MAHSAIGSSPYEKAVIAGKRRSKYVKVRKSVLAFVVLLYLFSVFISFSLGRYTAPQTIEPVGFNPPGPIIIDEGTVVEDSHTPKAAYEAGWRACMQYWGISSNEGLSFETASITIFPDAENGIFDYEASEVVLLSEYYSSVDISSARALFKRGFKDCMSYWNISYAYSNRKYDDDITYGFNSWYS